MNVQTNAQIAIKITLRQLLSKSLHLQAQNGINSLPVASCMLPVACLPAASCLLPVSQFPRPTCSLCGAILCGSRRCGGRGICFVADSAVCLSYHVFFFCFFVGWLRLWMSDRLQTSKHKQNYLALICLPGRDGKGESHRSQPRDREPKTDWPTVRLSNWLTGQLADWLSGHSTTWSLPIAHDERSVLAFTCYMDTVPIH